ncbi:MAG: hypothetical protein AAFZ09_09335 [Pseudomonadota bacterium]
MARNSAPPIPPLRAAARAEGAINLLPEEDMVLRRAPLFFVVDGVLHPSLPVASLMGGGRDVAVSGRIGSTPEIRIDGRLRSADPAGVVWLDFARRTRIPVIEARAAELGVPLRLAGRDWRVRAADGGVLFEDAAGTVRLPMPALPGAHQVENAGVAVAALRALGQPAAALSAALSGAEWPARLQRLTRGPLTDALPEDVTLWLDGGHNPAAGEVLAAHFAPGVAATGRKLALVVGMLDTKDPGDFLRPLAPLVGPLRSVRIPGAAAALPAEALAEAAARAGIAGAEPAQSVAAALEALRPGLGSGDQVVICGSLYLAGDVLAENG